MRYDLYLAAGYRIVSGVIEGACRHFIKAGMERARMRWAVEHAQAAPAQHLLEWGPGWIYRLSHQTRDGTRLYPSIYYRDDTLEDGSVDRSARPLLEISPPVRLSS